jgi:hypothetical protein
VALANAQKQASWRDRHLKKRKQVARSVHFRRQHQGAAQTDRQSRGCSATSVIKEWAVSAERRATHQLSSNALTQYYDGE